MIVNTQKSITNQFRVTISKHKSFLKKASFIKFIVHYIFIPLTIEKLFVASFTLVISIDTLFFMTASTLEIYIATLLSTLLIVATKIGRLDG